MTIPYKNGFLCNNWEKIVGLLEILYMCYNITKKGEWAYEGKIEE